jgi:hypothetical protein
MATQTDATIPMLAASATGIENHVGSAAWHTAVQNQGLKK